MGFFGKNTEKERQAHWYDAASAEEKKEYDAFGPWILEVKTDQDLPPVFRGYFSDLSDSAFFLKIPIDQDRRDVRPGWPLYRMVVAVNTQNLTLLSLGEGAVEKHVFPLDQIQALRNFHVLLRGELSFFIQGGALITLGYNTVSRPMVEKLIQYICQQLSLHRPPFFPGEAPPAPAIDDFHYQTLLHNQQKIWPAARAEYFESPGTKGFDSRGKRRKSLGLLVVNTGKELLFMDRGTVQPHSLEAMYGGDCTYIPHGKITRLEQRWDEKKGKNLGQSLIVHLDGHSLGYRLFNAHSSWPQGFSPNP